MMKIKSSWLPLVLSSVGLLACGSERESDRAVEFPDFEPVQTEVMNIDLGASTQVQYQGLFAQSFAGGFPLSVGSGLRVYASNPKTGEALLYGLTDRGPNGDAPGPLHPTAQVTGHKVFPVPAFQPSLFRLKFSPGKGLELLETIGLTEGGKAISGRPIPSDKVGSSGEIALTENLKPLDFDPMGIDPEGIDLDKDGFGWLCDEYGPFLIKVDLKTGAILQKLAPGQGLPAILSQRQANRGFEGVAVAPNGRIYAIVQSTLDVAGKTKKVADFVRLVEYDPTTMKTRMFAFPIDAAAYSKTSDAKMGDLLAIGDGRFAVIEQGTGIDKAMHHVIYSLDIKDATDLSDRLIEGGTWAGKDLEYTQLASLANQGIQPAKKTLIADLRALGWTQEKAEGLALLNSKTLLVISDNDFGLKGVIEGGVSPVPDDYKVDFEGKLTLNAEPFDGEYRLIPAEEKNARTQFMILKLDKDVQQYF